MAGFSARRRAFLQQYPETLAIVPGRLAGEFLTGAGAGIAGVRRSTLTQLAAGLARPAMAERGLTPLSSLGLEAVTARVAHAALAGGLLKYFDPVAALPGFARALARTLSELRLAGIRAKELDSRGLARRGPGTAARHGTRRSWRRGRWPTWRRFSSLRRAMRRSASGCRCCCWTSGWRRGRTGNSSRAWPRDRRMSSWPRAPQYRGKLRGARPRIWTPTAPNGAIEHLRQYRVRRESPALPASLGSNPSGFEMFSAPGEGLEMAEVARRILKLAGKGIAFDQMAILLRNPDRYQAAVEDALRRAGVPAYFSRGTARPDPAGRAFLVLLKCAAENLSASSFAEYLSLGQVPAVERDRQSGSRRPTRFSPPREDASPAAAACGRSVR